MISLVIIPESTKMTTEVPADMVNKRLYVDIHEEEELRHLISSFKDGSLV
jgi:hypothetical protein